MKRREFIAGLGGAAAYPLTARAQQRPLPVIGYLGLTTAANEAPTLEAFLKGLGETGFVEGRNVTLEYRWAEGQYDRAPGLAAELVKRQVSVIFAPNTTPTLAAKAATSTIPIVFSISDDPVKFGLAASLNRPGGNATGVTLLATGPTAKTVGLLSELVPAAPSITALVNSRNPNLDRELKELQEGARAVGRQIEVLRAATSGEIDEAFRALARQRAGALIIAADAFFVERRHQITALAAHYRIPTIYQFRQFVEADGLLSYGSRGNDLYRQDGIYVGRILKGERPGDLPIMQVTTFELVINLKAARAIGVEVPPKLLALADVVIE
jgi:putative tryptophan/tyrosine transport system substrate-binding protein